MTPEQREKLAEAVAQRREALAGTTPAERRQARRQALRERRSEALEQGAAPVADDGTGGSGE
jgi:Spy/CpxP family protein refolding chaperone